MLYMFSFTQSQGYKFTKAKYRRVFVQITIRRQAYSLYQTYRAYLINVTEFSYVGQK